MYITSLGGLEGHGKVSGVAALYKPTKDGFRVYVYSPFGKYLTIEDAAAGRWHVNWIGFRKDSEQRPKHVAYGRSTLWTQKTVQGAQYLKNDIITEKGNFKHTPMYLTSLTGTAKMYQLVGTSAIYSASLDHFAVWLHPKMGSSMGLNTRAAAGYKWAVDWVGLGAVHVDKMRFGWTNDWINTKSGKGVHVNVKLYKPFDPKSKKLPRFFAALQGHSNGHMYASVGSTSIYNVSSSGCTVYVHFTPGFRYGHVTANKAKRWGWTLEYLATGHEVGE